MAISFFFKCHMGSTNSFQKETPKNTHTITQKKISCGKYRGKIKEALNMLKIHLSKKQHDCERRPPWLKTCGSAYNM